MAARDHRSNVEPAAGPRAGGAAAAGAGRGEPGVPADPAGAGERLRIRVAGVDDAEAIENVRRPSWRAAYTGLIPDAVIKEFTGPGTVRLQRANLSDGSARRVLVAELGTGVVGFAAFGPERVAGREPAPDTTELYALYVLPERWSAGIGHALLARVTAMASAAGHDRLTLWVLEANARARRFYERAGFTPTGERQHQERLGGVAEVRYTKVI